ncbi:MAG TPA: hypothetical protein VEI02_16430, partial [Planctomycetota bacterium]|nr:hypothetical protein [Planctomycetota bacterium]
LQHPLGVAIHGDALLVADAYNHKVRRLDLRTRRVSTVAGTGAAGTDDGKGRVAFFEPSGIDVVGETAIIADANNHRLVAWNLATGAWREIAFEGLAAPPSEAASRPAAPATSVAAEVAPDADATFEIEIRTADGVHLSPDAPATAAARAGDRTLASTARRDVRDPLVLRVPAAALAGVDRFAIDVAYGLCADGPGATCVAEVRRFAVTLTRRAGAPPPTRLVAGP